jgi:DNA-binding LacI/PurR family transcriptional regulator
MMVFGSGSTMISEALPHIGLTGGLAMSPVTIRDVADKAGVGLGTVSRVLNDHPAVSDATRQKVLAAIETLHYTPNPIARRLSLGKTLTIGVIVPFFTRPALVERLRGIEYVLANSEYDLILFNVETVARRDACFRDLPHRERVDGLLIVSLSPLDDDVDRFLQARVPTVLIDAYHPRLSRVVIDDVAGSRLAIRHLIELGHHRIAYVSDLIENPFNFVSSGLRLTGYRQALSEAGLPFRPEYHRQADHGRDAARKMAREVLALPEPPTAIFASSDTQAIGVLEAARALGLQVPDDLSVIGYDDIEMAEHLALTTVRQPLFALGVEGVEILLNAIASPPSSPQQVCLPVDLIVRSTTAPPPVRD